MGQNRELSRFPNAITVLDNGNVGIGTTSPASLLSVGGAGYADRAITAIANGTDFAMTVQQNSTGAGIQILRNGGNWGNNSFQIQSTSGGTQFVVNSSGNVGIGTSSPSTLLDVNGNLNISSSGNLFVAATSGIFFNGFNSFATGIYNDGNALLRFATNGADRMRINQNGDIRIGDPSGADGRVMIKTTSPVAYNANNYNGTNANIRLMTAGSPGTGSTTGISFGIGGSAEAYIGAVQNSSTYAEIVFQTYNGSNYGERARINSNGIFTISSQPSFYAASTAGQTDYNSGEVIVFNTTRHNIGGHYNTSNGRFTAPVAGKYLFSANLYAYGGYRFSITLTVNGSQYSPSDLSPLAYHETTVGEMTTGFTLIWDLAAGDYVEVRSRAGYGSRIYRGHSHFSGQLLS